MRCPACGVPSDQHGARFCTHCGGRLEPQPRPSAEISVTQTISGSSEGQISGVSVGEIAGNVTMNIVQVHVSPEIIEEIRAVPTELQPASGADPGANPPRRDALKQNIQHILEAAARGNPRALRIRIGEEEVSRVDMLLKQAVLLETEASQMFLDTVADHRDAIERAKASSDGPTFQLDLADFLSGFDGDAHDRKLKEALALLEEANRLDPTNTEVLVHMAGVLNQIHPEDSSQPRRLLYRVQQLLQNPKNETEKFRLAQATFLLATSGPQMHEEALLQAREMFKQLGRISWVNQCDLQLRSLRRSGSVPQEPSVWTAPLQLDPCVGSWQVSISDGRVVNMTLARGGAFQASMMVMPGIGYQALGTWQSGPTGSFVEFQGVLNGVYPFAVRIVIQSRAPNLFTGFGSDGLFYQFQRTG